MATQFASGTDNAIGTAPKSKQSLLPVVVKVGPVSPVKQPEQTTGEMVPAAVPPLSNFKAAKPLEAIKQEPQTDQSVVVPVSP
jgi:hypothetical protein